MKAHRRSSDVRRGRLSPVTPELQTSMRVSVCEKEALESYMQRIQHRTDHESQHGRLVHVLMENGKPCDKWVEVDFNSRSGFAKRLPKDQGTFRGIKNL